MRIERAAYRLDVSPDGLKAVLTPANGRPVATLRLLAALDVVDSPDETLALEPPRLAGDVLEVERRSSVWDRAGVSVLCREDSLEVRAWVEGDGDLADVHLLGGRSLIPGGPTGFMPSGSVFRTLFSPNPADHRLVRPATEAAVIGVSGDMEPGRHHWLFTPAPLYLALTTDEVHDPEDSAPRGWLDVAVATPVDELRFVQLAYLPRDGGFSLRLEYEGHTRVDGGFAAPPLVITPGVPDPYSGLRRHRGDLLSRRAVPPPRTREGPAWWNDPIFCGWGAQCHLAETNGGHAAAQATQERYDQFVDHLDRHGVSPRTLVIDDKWQAAYGTNEPDPAKWPDLRGWIARRHVEGRRVLLWWKAWDPEGLPASLCVRNAEGAPIALDPSNPAARAELRRIVWRMVGPDGLDADGLKIDFTGRTPSGRALVHNGPAWGISLLHQLLATVYTAAKKAKPDALIITHAPHPAFVDVTDMIRLNDMFAGAPSVVPQMRYRAAVTHAVVPELPIDTDDWRVPSLAAWREYLAVKPELGVPSLYYVSHLDATGESFDDADYVAVRAAWDRWEAAQR